jgi:hypothetical protein
MDMALTCNFPQLVQAYGSHISNTIYFGLPIYFTLRPTVASESLMNLRIEKFGILTTVLMKNQGFWNVFCDSWKYPEVGGSTLFQTFGNNLLVDK